jgi:F-type H+-transporting ATPase subunit epsilon
MGEIAYREGTQWRRLTCFWGFCEVLPDRVNVLADIGERPEDIDVTRAEEAMKDAAERMKSLRDEQGYAEARASYTRAVTRLAVARKP